MTRVLRRRRIGLQRARVARALVLFSLLTLHAGSTPAAAAVESASPPAVTAASAVLLEEQTGTALYERAADVPRPPASTTKILTGLIVVERLRLETRVPISARASAQRSGAAIGLEVGESWRVGVLLDALLLASANDAAVALAEAAAGSVERFAGLMNERARAAGARHSTFVVPHGLYDPAHLTTARDLALITREAMRRPAFAAIVRKQVFTWQREGLPPRVVVNRNRLLWTLPGADGVKTGWISQSGQCLVASATRGGRRLLVVVLDSADPLGDTTRLLEYGFARFRLARPAARGDVLVSRRLPGADVPLEATITNDLFVVARREAAMRSEVVLRPGLRPPITLGEDVGELRVYAGGTLLGRAPLVAASAVPARSVWRQVEVWMRGLVGR